MFSPARGDDASVAHLLGPCYDAQMVSDIDIDRDAKAIVEKHGEKVINDLAIDLALRADRARAADYEEEAAFWRRAADGLHEVLNAAQVPRERPH